MLIITPEELEEFEKSRRDGSYICRICGNGSGKDGTGLTKFTMYDGRTSLYYCHRCHESFIVKEIRDSKKTKWMTCSDIIKKAMSISDKEKKKIVYNFLENRKLSRIVELSNFNEIFRNVVFLNKYIAFPLKNLSLEVVDFKIFLLNDNHIKLNTRKESQETGFITDFLIYPNKPIFIVESIINALTCVFLGFNAISINSCNMIKFYNDIVKKYYQANFTNFVIMLDKDAISDENAYLISNNIFFKFPSNYPENFDINDLFIQDHELCYRELEKFDVIKKGVERKEKLEQFIETEDIDLTADINIIHSSVGSGKTTFIADIFFNNDVYVSNSIDSLRDFSKIVNTEYLSAINKETYDYSLQKLIITHERLGFDKNNGKIFLSQDTIRKFNNFYIDEYDTLFSSIDIPLMSLFAKYENEYVGVNKKFTTDDASCDVFYYIKNFQVGNNNSFLDHLTFYYGELKKNPEIQINGGSIDKILTDKKGWKKTSISQNIYIYDLKQKSLKEMYHSINNQYEKNFNGMLKKMLMFGFEPKLIMALPVDKKGNPVFFDEFINMTVNERKKLNFGKLDCYYFEVVLRVVPVFWLVRILAENKKIFLFSGTKKAVERRIWQWLNDNGIKIKENQYSFIRQKYDITVFRTNKKINSSELKKVCNNDVLRSMMNFVFFAKNSKMAYKIYQNINDENVRLFFQRDFLGSVGIGSIEKTFRKCDVYDVITSSFSSLSRGKNMNDYNIIFMDANFLFPKFKDADKSVVEIISDIYMRIEQLSGRVLRGNKKRILFFIYNDDFSLNFDFLKKFANDYFELFDDKTAQDQFYSDDIDMLIFKILNNEKLKKHRVIIPTSKSKKMTDTEKRQLQYNKLCKKIEVFIEKNFKATWKDIYAKFNLQKQDKIIRELLKCKFSI